MLHSRQHLSLVVGMLDLLHLDNLGFLQHLDGIKAAVVFRPDQVDATETASAQCPFEIKVPQGVFALGRFDIALHRPAAIRHGPYAGLLSLLRICRRLALGHYGLYSSCSGTVVCRRHLVILGTVSSGIVLHLLFVGVCGGLSRRRLSQHLIAFIRGLGGGMGLLCCA